MKKLGIAEASSETFDKDFGVVLRTSNSTLMKISSIINTDEGFSINDTGELIEIWGESNQSTDDLQSVVSVLKHIYDGILTKDLEPLSVLKELEEYCSKKGLSHQFEERKSAIEGFITPTETVLNKTSYLPYTTSVAPNLYSISSVVELRAVFEDKNSSSLSGFVPVAQVRLIAINDSDKKADIPFAFQVKEKGLKKLIDDLKITLDQLKAIKSIDSSDIKIISIEGGIND